MNVQPGSSFEAVIDTGTPGLVGVLGLEVNDNVGALVIGFTSSGVSEIAPGVYSLAGVVAPSSSGQYTIIWRAGATGAVYGVEDLTVTTGAPLIVPPPPTFGTGMTGSDLITEFLADKRFGQSRTRVLRFLNYRYTELLGLEEWDFLQIEAPVSLYAATIPVPTAFGIGHRLWLDDTGQPLRLLTVSSFLDAWASVNDTGRPVDWTITAQSILIGPTPDATYPATLYYQAEPPPLADDTNPSILPAGTEECLVAGAQAFALELENDPTGGQLEARFQRTIDGMRRRYLTSARAAEQQMPRDPLAYR